MRPHDVLRRIRCQSPTLRHFLRLEVTVLEYFIVCLYCAGCRVLKSDKWD
jgi:hypothetical protein